TEALLKEEGSGKVNGAKELELDLEPPEVEERKERVPRTSRREEVPLEKVSVEMTPIEQDVYALMGISPLVRLNREFKDPKSVLISVKLPGETEVSEKFSAPETAVSVAEREIESEEELENGETDYERPLIRRRRRRSSAKEA
ncbi:MAG: Rne/Rng family ribonuclease, partial [Microcystaceae cyanobacterium]